MVRAIMHGCNGKMGRAITTLAKEDAEVESGCIYGSCK